MCVLCVCCVDIIAAGNSEIPLHGKQDRRERLGVGEIGLSVAGRTMEHHRMEWKGGLPTKNGDEAVTSRPDGPGVPLFSFSLSLA